MIHIYRGELPELHRRSIGPDLVFGRLWAETGCRDVLQSLLADRRFCFDVERAVYLTVLHRLMISGSDRHASEWRSGLRVPGADGLDLDHAYKAMAWLGALDDVGRSMAEAVEEALYRHRQPLFGAVSIAFFDTTRALLLRQLMTEQPAAGSRRRARFIPPSATATTASLICPRLGRRRRWQRPVHNDQRLSALANLRKTIPRQRRCPMSGDMKN